MESEWTEVNCYMRHDATRYDGAFRYYDSHPEHQGTGLKTTILTIHGVGYNSEIFGRMPSHLRNSRIVAVNQRGFRGSSSGYYLQPKPDAADGYQRITGAFLLDTLHFMRYIITGRQTGATPAGNLIVLGWSKGCALQLALLMLIQALATSDTHATTPLPFYLRRFQVEPFIDVLRENFQGMLFYEPTGTAIGLPATADFLRWRSSVGPHISLADSLRTLLLHGVNDCHRCEDEELIQFFEHAAEDNTFFESYGVWRLGTTDEEVRRKVKSVLTPPPRLEDTGYLPSSFGLGVIYGTDTEEYCMDATMKLMEYAGWPSTDEAPSSLKTVDVMDGASHIAMITHPQMFCDLIENFIDARLEAIPPTPTPALLSPTPSTEMTEWGSEASEA